MMALLTIELKFKLFRIKFTFILNVVFTLNFLKMARVHFSPGFPPGAGFPGEELALACFYTSEELISGAFFPWRLLQRSSESGEECSGGVLEPRYRAIWPR
jgi:hypothetical protein